ncbi:hypothetical protein LPJ78_003731 [Coemansia sp. RSA 989]|nr:hypothetical protein LPJ68_002869 [Coemansia sp. RSA 1086]KAJ1749748.1 hypothetical protein LPJ79_003485 [Coemansia sp. RSA 1821]KAJ1863933.1 hypothetical protein LPJ78_003731 [Coemansia sp. RSA 989]KAJ1871665.1 hypothetical protein LPJ55_003728 [Coemansia sp. RSA 990]KAJ2633640.1 hypothetical protein H4R22_000298 [Coemansia sp. RSA 1290]KAJ2650304.1 hypothetical protein IWW40_002481 [Coemansia sp. RSA 1250]KAJ2675652.1 hypothetical protein IWW42_001074 [Coemansia sp. RSA 1085]
MVARRSFWTARALHTPYPYKLIFDAKSSVLPPASSQAAVPSAVALRFPVKSTGQQSSDSVIGWIRASSKVAADSQIQISPQNFIENRQFWPLVLEVLEKHVHEDPELQAQAAFQKTGWMNIADGRNPPPLGRTGNAEDIVGCVLVKDKAMVPGTFQSNWAHRPVTADGLFQLPKYLHAKLLERLS